MVSRRFLFGRRAEGVQGKRDALLWLIWVAFGWVVGLYPRVCLAGAAQPFSTNQPALQPGLQVTLNSIGSESAVPADIIVLPLLALNIPQGESASPFLPPGPFRAVWEGYISVELREEYQFQAELNGTLKLEINGKTVLEGNSNVTQLSPAVRLNKGTNGLRAIFTSRAGQPAFLRMDWAPQDSLTLPIPASQLSHPSGTPELARATELHQGRALYLEHRCARCHGPDAPSPALGELSLNAPTFEEIGSRRQFSWLKQWILDPKSSRRNARMPQIFHSATAAADAEACAAFLASLTGARTAESMRRAQGDDAERGKGLFDDLHCGACHEYPGTNGADPTLVSLRHVAAKFSHGSLNDFLRKPEAHYAWTRMPNFKLTEEEAAQLATFLLVKADQPAKLDVPESAALVARGRTLIQQRGCLNCHQLALDNSFAAKPLSRMVAPWQGGCLSESPVADGNVPFFGFNATERQALRRFGTSDRLALTRESPVEFAQVEIENLRCRECHGKFDGFPALDGLGGKLRPEWSQAFIAGEIPKKPRPWLVARMPAFPQHAAGLARGMAMIHGFPPLTQAEPPIDLEASQVGQKLVAAQGGLACISCHAIGTVQAIQVFENNGINLALTTSRLLKPYFHRWVRNPLALDPVSKMPAFFDEQLRSPLTDYYDGDGRKQLEAIWQYLRLGDEMPPPPGN